MELYIGSSLHTVLRGVVMCYKQCGLADQCGGECKQNLDFCLFHKKTNRILSRKNVYALWCGLKLMVFK